MFRMNSYIVRCKCLRVVAGAAAAGASKGTPDPLFDPVTSVGVSAKEGAVVAAVAVMFS